MSDLMLFKPVENNQDLEKVVDLTLTKNGAVLHRGNMDGIFHHKLYEIQDRGAISVCIALNGNPLRTTLKAREQHEIYEGPGILSLIGFDEKSYYYTNLKQAIEADLRPGYLF